MFSRLLRRFTVMAETQKSETKFIVDEQQARIDLAALLRYGVG